MNIFWHLFLSDMKFDLSVRKGSNTFWGHCTVHSIYYNLARYKDALQNNNLPI